MTEKHLPADAFERLENWAAVHAECIESAERLYSIGCAPEANPIETIWRVFGAYTFALASWLGDQNDMWLDWFWQENEMGAREFEAGWGDANTRKIKTLADLMWLLRGGVEV
jgi:hypothetical protein